MGKTRPTRKGGRRWFCRFGNKMLGTVVAHAASPILPSWLGEQPHISCREPIMLDVDKARLERGLKRKSLDREVSVGISSADACPLYLVFPNKETACGSFEELSACIENCTAADLASLLTACDEAELRTS
jgi:hypothetical protein